jgi:hypothetical protein
MKQAGQAHPAAQPFNNPGQVRLSSLPTLKSSLHLFDDLGRRCPQSFGQRPKGVEGRGVAATLKK